MVSPQNIDSNILMAMKSLACLRHFVLLQVIDTITPTNGLPCSREAWANLVAVNKNVQVHLRVQSEFPEEIIIQPGAPVSSITYHSSYIRV